jgi:hypothetical protein
MRRTVINVDLADSCSPNGAAGTRDLSGDRATKPMPRPKAPRRTDTSTIRLNVRFMSMQPG